MKKYYTKGRKERVNEVLIVLVLPKVLTFSTWWAKIEEPNGKVNKEMLHQRKKGKGKWKDIQIS